MTNQLLTSEDSFAVREEIIRQLRSPKAFFEGGLGALICSSIERAVTNAVKDSMFTGFNQNFGEKLVVAIADAVSKK